MSTFIFPSPQLTPFTATAVNFARPNNTTQYVAGRVVQSSLGSLASYEVANVGTGDDGVTGQNVILTGAELYSENDDTAPIMFQGRLYVFKYPVTMSADNGQLDISFPDLRQHCVAIINLNEGSSNASSTMLTAYNFEKVAQLDVGNTSLYVTLQVTNAYVPMANEDFTIILKGKR